MITALWLTAASALAGDPDLTFQATGLATDGGQVICTLWDREEVWLDDPGWVATTKATPKDGAALCVFPSIPPGTYAIAFFQDLNGNVDMDSNLFGLPKEPWGMSLDAPIRFGPPSFDKSSFQHPSPTVITGTAH